jgi:hypothetical protein
MSPLPTLSCFYRNNMIFSSNLEPLLHLSYRNWSFFKIYFHHCWYFDCSGYSDYPAIWPYLMLHSVAVKNATLPILSILIRVSLPSCKLSFGSYIFHHTIELTFFHIFHYYYHLKIRQNAVRLILCIKRNRALC